ncbi:MAG: histidine phosphatase family protein [Verrucomicrobiota bacterium]|jgi:broad specificity phosphatase PhoE
MRIGETSISPSLVTGTGNMDSIADDDGNSHGIIYFVRHGATKLNRESGVAKDIIRGHLDVPLADSGYQEAHRVASQIKNSAVRTLFSSDLSRAAETARIIAKSLRVTVSFCCDLRPWKLGPTIEGHFSDDVQHQIAYYFKNPDECPVGGESFREFKGRVYGAIAKIRRQARLGPSVIVTHFRCVKLFEARTTHNTIDPQIFLSHGCPTGTIRILSRGIFGDFIQ